VASACFDGLSHHWEFNRTGYALQITASLTWSIPPPTLPHFVGPSLKNGDSISSASHAQLLSGNWEGQEAVGLSRDRANNQVSRQE